MTPGLAYHRRNLARQMRSWWWTPDSIKFTEYAWSRSLDKSPRRPLDKLVQAERRIAS